MRPRRIRVVRQRKEWDCGVASLAMLIDKPYGDVAAALRSLFPEGESKFRKRGLILDEMVILASAFGCTLEIRWRSNTYLEGETGILTLKGEKFCTQGHYVVLKDGTHLVDPDGADVWSLKDYLSRHSVRTATLLAWRK